MIIAILAVSSSSYRGFIGFDFFIEGICIFMEFDAMAIPYAGLLGVLLIKALEVLELDLITRCHIDIGALDTLLHLAEAIQDIA